MLVKCFVCNTSFKRSPSRVKEGKKAYCSRQCVNIHRANIKKISVKCSICEEVFTTHISRTKINSGKFCSRKCFYASRKGIAHSFATKQKIGQAQVRIKNHNWKGGIIIAGGYIKIKYANHPFSDNQGYVMKHRLIMETHLGRYLTNMEIVHHINGVIDDNRLENLMYFPNTSAHISFHHKLRKLGSTHK